MTVLMRRMSRRTALQLGAGGALSPLMGRRAHAAATLDAVEVASGVFVCQGRHELMTAANEGHIANLSFVIGDTAIAVIDTGGSARVGAALKAAIRRISDRPIRYVINTHMHPDHIFGNAAFLDAETRFVGHAKLPRSLAARGERYLARGRADIGPAFEGTTLIAASDLVASTLTLDLGGRTLSLRAHATAHTDNDMTITDDKSGTLFLGDLLFSGHVPTLDGSIRGWQKILDELSQRPAPRVVPGHGPVSMPWPQGVIDEQRYLATVTRDVRALIKAGKTLDDAILTAGVSEKDAWLLFDEFHKRNVSAAFAELEWE